MSVIASVHSRIRGEGQILDHSPTIFAAVAVLMGAQRGIMCRIAGRR